MRKRKHLVWVLGLALALGVSAVATGATTGNTFNTQTMNVTVTPSKQSKTKFGNAKLRSLTTTGSTQVAPYGITPINGDPGAIIDYDKDIKFDATGIPTCKLSQLIGTTPAQALARCKSAQVGTGQLTVGLAGSPAAGAQIDGSVLAFNGPPKNGHSILYLHVRVDLIANTTILTGTLTKSSGKYGYRLNVKVDPLPNGAAAKVFDVTVNHKPVVVKKHKTVRRHGKKVRITVRTTHYYVSAKCSDPTWDFGGKFIYAKNPADTTAPDRSGTITTTSTQPCTAK